MRIAHYFSNVPGCKGSKVYGKSLAAYNVCVSLGERGHHLDIYTITSDKTSSVENNGFFTIYKFPSLCGYNSERLSLEILRKVGNEKPDIIHVHSGISITTFAGLWHSLRRKIPLVTTWHGDSIKGHGRYEKFIPTMATHLYKVTLADKLLVNSASIITPSIYYADESIFLREYKHKITEIPNGIKLEDYSSEKTKEECRHELGLEGKYVVLFVGSLYELKGPDTLLKAASHVTRLNDKCMFVFVGGGDLEKYKDMAKQLGIERYVTFAGYIGNPKEKTIYYRSADLLALPSCVEVFPLVLLEASACGLPLVVSNLNTLRCIVRDNWNGMFVPIGDPDSLAATIQKVLNDESLRLKMGTNAREYVNKFLWSEIARQTEYLYLSILA